MDDIAYLVNRYPSQSHTFIRREIEALEKPRLTVHRFSHRPINAHPLEAADQIELRRTQVLISSGVMKVVGTVLRTAVGRPVRFAHALTTAVTMAGRDGRLAGNLGYVILACLLGRLLRKRGIRRLHAHFGTNPASVAMHCRGLFDIPFSFTAHGPHEFADPAGLSIDRKIAAADFVVVVSEHGRQLMHDRFPHHSKKIHLIRCGLDDSWMSSATVPIPGNSRFVSIARLDEQKNPLLLIRAIAALRDAGTLIHLTIAGDGPLRGGLEREIRRLKLTDRVTLPGWQTQQQIAWLLHDSRALVLSSGDEGLPVAIMEAFAMGRPVIASNVGGVRELVQPGVTGWLIPPHDQPALVEAIRSCVQASTQSLSGMAAVGRANVLARHCVGRSAEQLASLFAAG